MGRASERMDEEMTAAGLGDYHGTYLIAIVKLAPLPKESIEASAISLNPLSIEALELVK